MIMKRFGRKHFTTTKGEIIKIIQDIVRTHMVMQNAKHSRPYTGSSLAYWEKEMNLQITYWKCPHCNTFFKRSELEGGHVVLMNQQEGEQWITPICKEFNESKDCATPFFVEKKYLVVAP